MKEDSDAQDKIQGEIVGLDFDPFLGSQDPCERYRVGRVSSKGATYRVAIHGVCFGKQHGEPDAVAEVIRKNDRWLFVNVRYAHGRDLLSVLKSLHESRLKEGK